MNRIVFASFKQIASLTLKHTYSGEWFNFFFLSFYVFVLDLTPSVCCFSSSFFFFAIAQNDSRKRPTIFGGGMCLGVLGALQSLCVIFSLNPIWFVFNKLNFVVIFGSLYFDCCFRLRQCNRCWCDSICFPFVHFGSFEHLTSASFAWHIHFSTYVVLLKLKKLQLLSPSRSDIYIYKLCVHFSHRTAYKSHINSTFHTNQAQTS